MPIKKNWPIQLVDILIYSFGHQLGQLREDFPGPQISEHFTSTENNGLCSRSLFQGCSCNQQPYIQNLPLNGTVGMCTVQEERSRTPHLEFLSSERTHCTGHSTWPSSHCSVGTGALGADTRKRWYTATATTFRSSAIICEIVAAKFSGSKEDKISDLSQPLTWTGH